MTGLIQSFATAIGSMMPIPTGAYIVRIHGNRPKRGGIDIREIVFYKCHLAECFSAEGLIPCEYLQETKRGSLEAAKSLAKAGLFRGPAADFALADDATELRYYKDLIA